MSIVKVADCLDAKVVGPLANSLMLLVKAHLEKEPPHRNQVLEVLNALAINVAAVLAVNEGEGREFFDVALRANIEDIAFNRSVIGHA